MFLVIVRVICNRSVIDNMNDNSIFDPYLYLNSIRFDIMGLFNSELTFICFSILKLVCILVKCLKCDR